MEENSAPVQFIEVRQDTILSFIGEAKRRIVIAKPAYFLQEVNKLIEMAEQQVQCDIYMETNDSAIRYGFGEQAALEAINKDFDSLNVQSANYIRLAIIIVDDKVMVYSPVALSWEEVPEKINFPNGFIGGRTLADSLMRQIEGEPQNIDIEGLNIAIKECPVTQKPPDAIKKEISETTDKLKENPPVDPVTLRKTKFYRNKFKLLKMTIHGMKIKNKSLSLLPFNRILSHSNQRLKSSWKILTKNEVENISAIKDSLSFIEEMKDKYTFDAGRFGTLIEKKNMEPFEEAIDTEVGKLVEQLTGAKSTSDSEDNKTNPKNLYQLLADSRNALVDHLFPQAMADKDCWEKLFKNERSLYRRISNNEISEEEGVRQAVESFVDHSLHFPEAESMIEVMDVEFDYYDISDELLAKDDFIKQVQKFDLKVREYKDGYEKQEQGSLF